MWEGREEKSQDVRVTATWWEALDPPQPWKVRGSSRSLRWRAVSPAKAPLARKDQRGLYLLFCGHQRLEGLVHGSQFLLQLPGSAGSSRKGSENRTDFCSPEPEKHHPRVQGPSEHGLPLLPSDPHLSATSALSSERSSSPSRITSFLATCGQGRERSISMVDSGELFKTRRN